VKSHQYGFPILDSSACRTMDAAVEAQTGLPLAVLMENAGRAVANASMEFDTHRVLVAAGSGNNGGDGFVTARILLARGVNVEVACVRPVDELSGPAQMNARRFLDEGGRVIPVKAANWSAASLIIDAFLGTGFSGPVRPPVNGIISSINAVSAPVLSIDVPSGLASDDCAEPECAVKADMTIALGCYKPSLVHYPACGYAGEVRLADIGFPATVYPEPGEAVLSSAFVRSVLPRWSGDSHKGKRGRLLVVAGSRGMLGAAALACEAATRAGAGLVYLACPEPLAPVFEAKLTNQVIRPVASDDLPYFTPASVDPICDMLASVDAVAIGPGISLNGESIDFTKALLPDIETPCVIDADGLNAIAEGAVPPANSVLTPHPGEMSRLLRTSVDEIQNNRPASARKAAALYSAVVALKGAHTVVAGTQEPAVVNLASDASLATAGSGDILTGIIGALLAQGLTPFEAALAGVRWHGTAGVLAASTMGATPGATDILTLLGDAREEILNDDEMEYMA